MVIRILGKFSLFTLSCIMPQYGQTHFKKLAACVSGYFRTLSIYQDLNIWIFLNIWINFFSVWFAVYACTIQINEGIMEHLTAKFICPTTLPKFLT